jgi:hypothetical protein
MSIFASSAASFQPVISEAVNAVGRNRFAGAIVLPFYSVDKSQGKYSKITAAQFDNDVTKPRAAGSNFAQTSSEFTAATFECLEYGAENSLDDLDIASAESDAQLDITTVAANQLADDLMIGHEIRVANALSGASFTSTAATAAMSVVASATPIADINAAVLRLNADGVFDRIHLIMEASLYAEMLQTDDMRNLINGSGNMVWAKDQVARVLGVDEIVIANTRYNSAIKGQSASRSSVWPTTSYYVAQVADGPFVNGGIGRTAYFSARGGTFTSETFRTEQPPASVVRVRCNCDELIINASAGETISGA